MLTLALFAAYLIVASIYDLYQHRIPNWLNGLALVVLLITSHTTSSLIGLGGMAVILFIAAWLKVIGAGDWKMGMVMGVVLGLIPALIVFTLAQASAPLARPITQRFTDEKGVPMAPLVTAVFVVGTVAMVLVTKRVGVW